MGGGGEAKNNSIILFHSWGFYSCMFPYTV